MVNGGPDFKLARESAGLSIKKLAERAEVSPRSIGYWESGRRQPSRPAYARLAEVLDLPPLDDPQAPIRDFDEVIAQAEKVAQDAARVAQQLRRFKVRWGSLGFVGDGWGSPS